MTDSARDPVAILRAVKHALALEAEAKVIVYAIVDAILPDDEREAIHRAGLRLVDERTEAEHEMIVDRVRQRWEDAQYMAPERGFHAISWIAQAVLTRDEVAAIMLIRESE